MRGRRIASALLWIFTVLLCLFVWLSRGQVLALGALCAVLLLPAGSLLINLFLRRYISSAMTLAPTTPKKKDVEAVLTLGNDSVLSVRVLAVLTIHNALTEEKDRREIACTVPPRGKSAESCLLSSTRCGQITVTVSSVSLLDICGIFAVPCRGAGSAGRTTVLPDLFMPQVGLELLSASPDDSETYANDRRGSDMTEVWQLREYVPGDDLRCIHWKMSAKSRSLIVREGSLPLQRSLLVFWDKTAGGKMSPGVADALAESVSSICRALSEDGFAYTIGWSGEGQNTMCDADDTDRMLAVLPRLVRTAGEGDSGTAALAEIASENFFGRVLLFSHTVPEALDALCGKSAVTLFLCTDEAGDAPDAPCGVIRFTPRDYTDVLKSPEIL